MWWPWSTSPPPFILIVDVGRMGFLRMCFFGICWRVVVVFDWLFVCQHAVVKRGRPPLNWANQLCDGKGIPRLRKLLKDSRPWAEGVGLKRMCFLESGGWKVEANVWYADVWCCVCQPLQVDQDPACFWILCRIWCRECTCDPHFSPCGSRRKAAQVYASRMMKATGLTVVRDDYRFTNMSEGACFIPSSYVDSVIFV